MRAPAPSAVAGYAVALATAAYLAALHVFSSEAMCFAGSCSDWYREGPLARIGLVPLSALAFAFWLAYPLFRMRRPVAARWVVGALALTNATLLLVGVATGHGVCLWCAMHAGATALVAFNGSEGGLALSSVALPALFGLGLAYVSPARVVADASVEKALASVPPVTLRAASVPLLASSSNEPEILALVDLNCGHCAAWLAHAVRERSAPRRTLRLAWSSVPGPMPANEVDGNRSADGIAGDLGALRSYLASGALRDMPPVRLLPERRRSAAGLYRKLRLRAVPVFFVLTDPPRRITSAEAYDLLFP